jgi:anti-sigma regulatory factor (Ser/Thr protein kinase)
MALTAPNRDQQRLNLLVRAGELFHQSLEVRETLDNVARLAVGSFADICLFDLIDERSDRLFVTASAHRDKSREPALAAISSTFYIEEFGEHPVVRVSRTGQPFFVQRMDETTLREHAASRQHERYMREFGYRSKIVVPVIAHGQIFGALTFVRTRGAEHFDPADLAFALELGRRAGLAVANAKQFHRERYVAETLQRAFLPTRFPTKSTIQLYAHYRPGSTESDIGGDWYDAFDARDGTLIVSIGDVTGKGVDAARLMVLMRQAIRIAALDSSDPVQIAGICNRVLLSEQGDRLASVFIGALNPQTRQLRYVSAGHAPPFLRLEDGAVMTLASPGAPLGAMHDLELIPQDIMAPAGSMLVLYTDGLIEATRDVIAGSQMLENVIASDAVVHAADPAEFIERAVADSTIRDDIAILVARFTHPALRWQFDASDARAAYALREEFFRAISGWSNADENELTACGSIFAELIGNAARHAPGSLSVSLEQRGRDLMLHVIDKGPGFTYDPRLPPDVWSENGRGLFLVSMMAREVRVERLPGLGSHVCAMLPVHA